MHPLETAAETLLRDVQAFKDQCFTCNAKFKADCRVRFDDLQRSLKKDITEEAKSSKRARRLPRRPISGLSVDLINKSIFGDLC